MLRWVGGVAEGTTEHVAVDTAIWSRLRQAGAVALGSRITAMLLGLIGTSLLSRSLNDIELAAYWTGVSALSLVVLLAQNGIGQVTMSRISIALEQGRPTDASSSALLSLVLTVLHTIAACAIVLPFFQWLDRDASGMESVRWWFVPAGALLCGLALQCIDVLRGSQRLNAASLLAAQPSSGGLVPSLVLVMVLGFVMATSKPLGLAEALFLFLAGWTVLLMLALGTLGHRAPVALVWHSSPAHQLRILSITAAPVAASAAAMFVVTQADLWAVNFFLSGSDTAAYGIAAAFVKYVSAGNLLLGSLLPGLVGTLYARGDLVEVARLVVRLARIGAVIALVIFAIVVLQGGPLLDLTVGVRYRAALDPLVILAVAHVINSILGYSSVVLVTAGRTSVLATAALPAIAATLILLPLLTPAWGLAGAALASGIGMTAYNITTWYRCGTELGIWCHAFASIRPVVPRV